MTIHFSEQPWSQASATDVDIRARTGSASLYPVAYGLRQVMLSRNGVPLDPAVLGVINRMSVSLGANQQGSFTLEIEDPMLMLIDSLQGPNRGTLCEGHVLEISLGNAETPLKMVMAGTVSAITVELDSEEGLHVQVEGHDALSTAAVGNVYMRYMDEMNDYEVLSFIASKILDLLLSIDSLTQDEMTAPPGRARMQAGISYLDLIAELADQYGCHFWADGNILHFRRERPGKKISLERGVNLFSLSFRLSTSGQVGAVESRGWNTAQAEEVSARTTPPKSYWGRLSQAAKASLVADNAVHNIIVHDATEAKQRAGAEMRRLMGMLITGEGSTIGNPEMRVGCIVNVIGMARFDGEYQVQSLVHRIDNEGFRTDFTLRLHI
ncbi:phage late control D family protein [Undibacterium sp. Ji50W]|uniref:phage late control D family protein n=1 Tax=Undibacterium sp. Ji50W TaxID=3413041 RepID=UPI003BF38F49